MALARFTIYIANARARFGPLRATGPADSRTLRVGWRLLAANNRDVARAAIAYGDVTACLDAIRTVQGSLALCSGIVSIGASAGGRAEWAWRLRLGNDDLAVSSRTYQRRVQCEAAYELFVSLAPDAELADVPAMLRAVPPVPREPEMHVINP